MDHLTIKDNKRLSQNTMDIMSLKVALLQNTIHKNNQEKEVL